MAFLRTAFAESWGTLPDCYNKLESPLFVTNGAKHKYIISNSLSISSFPFRFANGNIQEGTLLERQTVKALGIVALINKTIKPFISL